MRRDESEGDVRYYRIYRWETPETTAEEANLIEQNRLACPKDRIIDLIMRYLEVHKKHIIDDQHKRQLLYADMAAMLYGLPEYALTLGVLDIVNDPKQIWFPNVGQVREAAEAHVLLWPYNLEPGEEPLRPAQTLRRSRGARA